MSQWNAMRSETTALVAAALMILAIIPVALAQMPETGAGPTTYRVARIPPTARIEVTGTFVLEVTLRVNADLPDGSSLTFSGTAAPSDDSYLEEVDVYNIAAKVANHQASATVTLPYAWLVSSIKDKVAISVYVTGLHEGAASVSGSSQLSATIDLPKNGASTTVKLAGAI
jgi:hypothetical protein